MNQFLAGIDRKVFLAVGYGESKTVDAICSTVYPTISSDATARKEIRRSLGKLYRRGLLRRQVVKFNAPGGNSDLEKSLKAARATMVNVANKYCPEDSEGTKTVFENLNTAIETLRKSRGNLTRRQAVYSRA